MSIHSLAKAAGVSTATVSRVMNGLPGASAETVAHVKAMAQTLNYRPQRVHLKKAKAPQAAPLRTRTLALITVGHGRDWLLLPVIASVIAGIQRGVDANRLRLLLGEMPNPTKICPVASSRHIDGAIVLVSSELSTDAIEKSLESLQARVPIVWAMGTESASGADHVMPDNVSVGMQAFNYLKKMGCRRYAFLGDHPQWSLLRMRGQAFLNASIDAGVIPTMHLIGGTPTALSAYGPNVVPAETLEAAVVQFAKARQGGDGLFIATDQLTTRAYPLLLAKGVRPEADVRIVSCDNEEARLASLYPRPASIDVGAEEIGFRAVQRLMNRIERPNGPRLVIQVSARLRPPSAKRPSADPTSNS